MPTDESDVAPTGATAVIKRLSTLSWKLGIDITQILQLERKLIDIIHQPAMGDRQRCLYSYIKIPYVSETCSKANITTILLT